MEIETEKKTEIGIGIATEIAATRKMRKLATVIETTDVRETKIVRGHGRDQGRETVDLRTDSATAMTGRVVNLHS